MITIDTKLFSALREFAKSNHPKEIVVLLRGRKNGSDTLITDYLIPPFSVGGRNFTSFPSNILPIDFTIVGTAHSHPTGILKPSIRDFHNFYGRIMVIIGPPYNNSKVAAYNKNGDKLPVCFSTLQR